MNAYTIETDLWAIDLRSVADTYEERLRELGLVGESYCAVRLRRIADQFDAQNPPPKPAEPTGLGAVVEDKAGRTWVRTEAVSSDTELSPWCPSWGVHGDDAQPACYADLDAVRVLSVGVQS